MTSDQHESEKAIKSTFQCTKQPYCNEKTLGVCLAITLLSTSPVVLMSWLTSVEDSAFLSSYIGINGIVFDAKRQNSICP